MLDYKKRGPKSSGKPRAIGQNISMQPELIERLKEEAARQDTSVSALVVKIVEREIGGTEK